MASDDSSYYIEIEIFNTNGKEFSHCWLSRHMASTQLGSAECGAQEVMSSTAFSQMPVSVWSDKYISKDIYMKENEDYFVFRRKNSEMFESVDNNKNYVLLSFWWHNWKGNQQIQQIQCNLMQTALQTKCHKQWTNRCLISKFSFANIFGYQLKMN